MVSRNALCFLICCSLSLSAGADEFPEIFNSQNPDDTPPTPEEAAALITVPDGFKVTLFAGEPAVGQPIDIKLDDKGRLWVAECYTYAGRGFEESLKDRLVILDDTDRDGQHDKRTVFWDQGSRLTSLLHGYGGVFILNDGTLSFIADKDRDDVPDGPPEVLLDGFNKKEIVHNIVNGLMFGPDGWIYGRHGIQGDSYPGKPGTPQYERPRMNCAIWRFHPTEHHFEVLCHGTTNPWGMDYNEYGDFFFTNNVIGHAWQMIPGAHYKRMYGADFNPYVFELIDQTADHYHWDTGKGWTDSRDAKGVHGDLGGGHSHCGGMIYQGDNWPEEYRGKLFMCNTHGRRVNMDIIERQHSNYTIKHGEDFLFANNPWFRGVSLIYGPDGGVYLSDWTDIGECHDADGVHRTSGRIYKITYGEVEPLAVGFDMQMKSVSELTELIFHKNQWLARRARRILQQQDLNVDQASEIRDQFAAKLKRSWNTNTYLQILWLSSTIAESRHNYTELDNLGLELRSSKRDEHQLANYLKHVAVARLKHEQREPLWTTPFDPSFSDFAVIARKADWSFARLVVVSMMRDFSTRERLSLGRYLVQHHQDTVDRAYQLMLWYALEPAVMTDVDRSLQIAEVSRIPLIREFIARRITLGVESDSDEMQRLVALLQSSEHREDYLKGIAAGLKGRLKVTPPANWAAVAAALQDSPSSEFDNLVQSISLVFGDGRALDALKAIVTDNDQPPADRVIALETLIEASQEDLSMMLVGEVTDRAIGTAAIKGLAKFPHQEAARRIIDAWGRLRADGREAAMSTLTARKEYATELLKAIEQERIEKSALSAFQARQIAAFGDDALTAKLVTVWGDIRETPGDIQARIDAAKETYTQAYIADANLEQGKKHFEKLCASCHRLYGEGGQIGPDLTGSNRDSLDYLFENMYAPSSIVPQQYRMSTIVQTDGRVLTGIIAAEDDRTVTLQMEKDKVTLDRGQIEIINPSQQSLMPNGLLEKLKQEEVRDLVGYLQRMR